ncbi:hypothetical protein QJQ45_007355 [Haematococcus lacustris]|nr:hypothetical protein QJQ45_007355 [Haematococcus lacustris]
MKMREDQASLARARDIKTMLIKSFQLDLVFLIDVTGSMEPSISMVRDKVNSIVRGIKGMHPRTVMRLAFVGYRDYHDEEPLVISPFFEGHDAASHLSSFAAGVQAQTLDPYGDYAEDVFSGIKGMHPRTVMRLAFVCYRDYHDAQPLVTSPFFEGRDAASHLSSFAAGVRAEGGDDVAEDVFSGLEAVCGLAWKSQGSRILVHIADAPCHRREFHDLGLASDDYLNGDRHNRSIKAILHKLQHELRLQVRVSDVCNWDGRNMSACSQQLAAREQHPPYLMLGAA